MVLNLTWWESSHNGIFISHFQNQKYSKTITAVNYDTDYYNSPLI